MYVVRPLRDELKVLSLELFGVSSHWRKMLDRGTVKVESADTKGRPVMSRVQHFTPETLLSRFKELKQQKIDAITKKQKDLETAAQQGSNTPGVL